MSVSYPSVESIKERLRAIAAEQRLLKRQLKLSQAYEDGLKANEGGDKKKAG